MTEKFTDEERAGLSAEELAVLDGEDDADILKEIVGEGESDGDAGAKASAEAEETEEEPETKAEAGAEPAKKADADEAAKAKADGKARDDAQAAASDDSVEEDDDEPFVPAYKVPPPENYEQRMADLDKKYDEVTAKFKSGEIELEDMLREHRAIDKERRELDAQKTKAEIAAEQAEQAAEQRWRWEVSRFMREAAKHEGIDYRVALHEAALEAAKKAGDAEAIKAAEAKVRTSRVLNGALDAEVKALAADEANADKSGEWFLAEAHKRVKAAFNLEGKSAKAAPEAKTKAVASRRQPPVDKLPKTLGGLPAAGAVDIGRDGEGEFAEANSLLESGDSMALEAYIAGKSAEWQERWARANS
ncbi:MAG TPA: hypothetical protein VNM24_11355 [Burkholderiales bacterium]|nr:hypothetical protein [Burkholderiales bacterium]